VVWQATRGPSCLDPRGPFQSDKVTRPKTVRFTRLMMRVARCPASKRAIQQQLAPTAARAFSSKGEYAHPRSRDHIEPNVCDLWPPSARWTERSANPPRRLQESRVWPNLQGRPEVRTSPRFVAVALNDLVSLARCSIPPLQALRACLPSRRPVAEYARPPLQHRFATPICRCWTRCHAERLMVTRYGRGQGGGDIRRGSQGGGKLVEGRAVGGQGDPTPAGTR
jgi:hypothetical protein